MVSLQVLAFSLLMLALPGRSNGYVPAGSASQRESLTGLPTFSPLQPVVLRALDCNDLTVLRRLRFSIHLAQRLAWTLTPEIDAALAVSAVHATLRGSLATSPCAARLHAMLRRLQQTEDDGPTGARGLALRDVLVGAALASPLFFLAPVLQRIERDSVTLVSSPTTLAELRLAPIFRGGGFGAKAKLVW